MEISPDRVMTSHLTSVELCGQFRMGVRSMALIDQFSRYQQGRGFSPQTVRRRRRTLMTFARFVEPKDIDVATLTEIEEWLGGYRAPRTRHAYRSDLRVYFQWALARDLIATNPAALVDPVKVPRALPRPLGPEVIAALYTGSRRTRRMIALGLFAGLRAGEIAALDSSDIALHTVPPMLTVRAGKGNKDRIVPVHPFLADLLSDVPPGPVFPNRDGQPIRSKSCSANIREHLAQCGITATAHRLRHSYGSELARVTKGNVPLIARLMGHANTNTTMGYIGWAGEGAEAVALMFSGEAA